MNTDLFISDSTLVGHLAGTYANDGLAVIPFILSEEVLAWGVRRDNEALLASADESIERATKDGTLAKTFRRWMAVE